MLCPALLRARAQSGAAVAGVVLDLHGTPQMGALVELMRVDATVVAYTFTDVHGRYVLSATAPGQYQLRASAAFLLPAVRTNLRLSPNMRAVANLTLTALVEIGNWFPAERRAASEAGDDWRWTLRSAASRPLLKVAGDEDEADVSSSGPEHISAASEQGHLTVMTDEGSFGSGGTHQALTLGRSEASGRAEVLRANLGVSPSMGDAASVAVNAGYQRQAPFGGETRVVAGYASQPEVSAPGASGLRSVTLASSERMAFGDAVMIDAGTLLSAERLMASRVKAAPFLRAVVTPAAGFALMYRYAAAPELQSSEDMDNIQITPEILSDAHGRPVALSGSHQELAASHTVENDTQTVSVYIDTLPFVALQGGGNLSARELVGLPVAADVSTGTFRVAVHGYTAHGVSFSWTHSLTHSLTPALATTFGMDLGSALARGDAPLALGNIEAGVHTRVSPAVSASLHGTSVRTGTSFRAVYRWQPAGTLNAVNVYNAAPEQAYLSCLLRQKLWSGRRLQGVNAVIEATNLLEEGYQPMVGPDGETLFLAQVPRTLQAGLSFSF